MVLFPNGGLGRLLVVIIVVTTIAYIVLNLVSFGGNRWITYTDVPVRIGLWKVCDTTTSGLCNYWTQTFPSNLTNTLFNGTKPSFVRSAQGLEIVSLIFYIFAALFIIVGLINLPSFPYKISFGIAAGLLFFCIIFLSASLGVMSDKGRDNHPGAFLDWAWWNGLVGLIMIIICFFSLIFLIIYMEKSLKSQLQKNVVINNVPKNIYPVIAPIKPIDSRELFNPMVLRNFSNEYIPDQMNYVGQNLMMNMNSYSDLTSPSPLITELFREIVNQQVDQEYERQLFEPYSQYITNYYL